MILKAETDIERIYEYVGDGGGGGRGGREN